MRSMNHIRTVSRTPLGPTVEGAQMGMCMTSPRLILAAEGPTLLWTIPEVCGSVPVGAGKTSAYEKKGVELMNCSRQ